MTHLAPRTRVAALGATLVAAPEGDSAIEREPSSALEPVAATAAEE